MIGDCRDRDGRPIPDDWYDHTKHDKNYKWSTERRIAHTTIGDATVSTVWLGLNHEYRPGFPPLIFETMIFGGQHGYEMRRYSTEEDAMRGHLDALARLRTGRPPFPTTNGDPA